MAPARDAIPAGNLCLVHRLVGPLDQFGGVEGVRTELGAALGELPPLLDYIERVMPASGFLVDDRLTLAKPPTATPSGALPGPADRH